MTFCNSRLFRFCIIITQSGIWLIWCLFRSTDNYFWRRLVILIKTWLFLEGIWLLIRTLTINKIRLDLIILLWLLWLLHVIIWIRLLLIYLFLLSTLTLIHWLDIINININITITSTDLHQLIPHILIYLLISTQ